MSPQITCLWRCKVTLVAFVWFFPTVCLQMYPQMNCLRGCIVTLVAFVWLFPTVDFQMSPQIACLRERRVALAAFVWLYARFCWFHLCIFNQAIILLLNSHHLLFKKKEQSKGRDNFLTSPIPILPGTDSFELKTHFLKDERESQMHFCVRNVHFQNYDYDHNDDVGDDNNDLFYLEWNCFCFNPCFF